MIFIFIFDIFFAVSGLVEVQRELDRLAATPGASGVDYWGIGADILALVLWVVAISIIGLAFAITCCKMSQSRVISIISYIATACFSLPTLFLLACFIF